MKIPFSSVNDDGTGLYKCCQTKRVYSKSN